MQYNTANEFRMQAVTLNKNVASKIMEELTSLDVVSWMSASAMMLSSSINIINLLHRLKD